MNIIIFGGSGFLGSHVADVATENGHDVTIFDLKKSAHIQQDQKMIEGDILNREQVQRAMEGQEVVTYMQYDIVLLSFSIERNMSSDAKNYVKLLSNLILMPG